MKETDEENRWPEKNFPVEVFAGSIMSANLVKSFLENAGINAFLKDEVMGTMNPWTVTPGGVGAVKVIVPSSEAEQALQLVKAFEDRLN